MKLPLISKKPFDRFAWVLLVCLMFQGCATSSMQRGAEIQGDSRSQILVAGATTVGIALTKRLEKRGLVSSQVGEPTAQRGGRRKRHYDIEAPGIMALRNSGPRKSAV